jgi:TPR repeat protein
MSGSGDPALATFSAAFEAQETGDLKNAIRLYKLAAARGFTPALTNLGNIYDDLLEPPQPAKAVGLYRKAVQQGSRAGAWCLAMHYRNQGRDRWYRYWLRRAAEMGEEDAIDELARMERD